MAKDRIAVWCTGSDLAGSIQNDLDVESNIGAVGVRIHGDPSEVLDLAANLERDALSMEYDRLLPQGSKTMANRRRVAELEARLGAVNRECSDLRLELKHAAAASTAEIGGTA